MKKVPFLKTCPGPLDFTTTTFVYEADSQNEQLLTRSGQNLWDVLGRLGDLGEENMTIKATFVVTKRSRPRRRS